MVIQSILDGYIVIQGRKHIVASGFVIRLSYKSNYLTWYFNTMCDKIYIILFARNTTMRMSCTLFLSFCLLLQTAPVVLAQTSFIGICKSVSGEVVLVSSGTAVTVLANMKFTQGDTIRTGDNSSVGLVFLDDTLVSLGPNSEMEIQSFLFNPVEQELSFVTRLLRGTFSFISGQIAKLAPQEVHLKTPDATLGVRGTHFLVKID